MRFLARFPPLKTERELKNSDSGHGNWSKFVKKQKIKAAKHFHRLSSTNARGMLLLWQTLIESTKDIDVGDVDSLQYVVHLLPVGLL